MVIEFVGFPASGKTTFADSLLDSSKSKNTTLTFPLSNLYTKSWLKRNLYKSTNVIKFYAKNYKECNLYYKQLNETLTGSCIDKSRLLFNNLFLISIQEKLNTSPDIFVFDEGTVQHLWGISWHLADINKIKDFTKFYKLPDLIIYMDTSREQLLIRNSTRIEKNNQKNNINLRHQKVLSKINYHKDNLEEIIKHILSLENDTTKIIKVTEDITVQNEKKEQILQYIQMNVNS